jgi:hypothetical protein
MATQANVPQAVPQSKAAVVSISTAKQDTITQTELAMLISLRGRLYQLETAVQNAEQSIRQRLEQGVSVEEGDHVAELKETHRANIAWKEKAIDLAERLGLNGPAWAANVLAHTTKTRTVSLNVE